MNLIIYFVLIASLSIIMVSEIKLIICNGAVIASCQREIYRKCDQNSNIDSFIMYSVMKIIVHSNKLFTVLRTDKLHNSQGKPNPPLRQTDINRYADEKTSIITGSSAHTLMLLKEGYVGEIDNAIVHMGIL